MVKFTKGQRVFARIYTKVKKEQGIKSALKSKEKIHKFTRRFLNSGKSLAVINKTKSLKELNFK